MGLEIRNTATEAQIDWLDTPELLGQLSIALRNVALHEGRFTADGEEVSTERVQWILFVQRIHQLLLARAADIDSEIEECSVQTGWQLGKLLEDCLRWPDSVPQLRESDGIRRAQRCSHCQVEEFPSGTSERLCDKCLLKLMDLIERRKSVDGVFLLRTYSASLWCPHADSETVMMALDEYEYLGDAKCAECLREEYEARRGEKV